MQKQEGFNYEEEEDGDESVRPVLRSLQKDSEDECYQDDGYYMDSGMPKL